MDWDLSVNAPPAIEQPEGDFLPSPGEKRAEAGLGSCLYLGPRGQRCSNRASASGFCPRHQPDGIFSGTPSGTPLLSPRRVGAILTILALLWPLLADIVRALIRLFR
jgi:hypothetical protein